MLKQLSKKTKRLLILSIILLILCIIFFPRHIYQIQGKSNHYTGRYDVIKKDIVSNDKLGYLISNGLVDPFYEDKYYYELDFDFKYKTRTAPYIFIGKKDSNGMIQIDDFNNNSKFNLELYDYHTNKKIKTINLFPILKNKLKGLYFLEGFSDGFLTKEGNHMIFNLPLRKELIKDEYVNKFGDTSYASDRVLVKIDLNNKKVSFNKVDPGAKLEYKDMIEFLSQELIYFKRHNATAYNYNHMTEMHYSTNVNAKYKIYVVFDIYLYCVYEPDWYLNGSNNDVVRRAELFAAFPELKNYIANDMRENKLLVIYKKQ